MCNSGNYSIATDVLEFIIQCSQQEHSDSYLIACLHRIQERYGFLSETHLDEVAHLLQVPTSKVFGVATFYHFFRLKPRGKFKIQICLGTACFVKGADEVLKAFESELGISLGETSSDGNFSIEAARCIGVCALAPVVVINEEVYSNVKPNQVPDIINRIKEKSETKLI